MNVTRCRSADVRHGDVGAATRPVVWFAPARRVNRYAGSRDCFYSVGAAGGRNAVKNGPDDQNNRRFRATKSPQA
jgi:hypothetical protein